MTQQIEALEVRPPEQRGSSEHVVDVMSPPSQYEGFEDCYDLECPCGFEHQAETSEEADAVALLHEKLQARVFSVIREEAPDA